ncbi:MAG: rRNA maturation RNase YbeY [Candidatus Eremiobacteraeota bacterium]|nr:rRNA maturation RNase YbeY [Candidatus Eremiobacteraeota bacterium]
MIYYHNTIRKSGVDARAIKRVAGQLLSAVDEPDSSLSLSLVSDRAIAKLNRIHRGKDRPTDVLSFPIAQGNDSREIERMLGDVVISVETARKQAAAYDASLQDEIYRLLIHGVLHVLGHDHEEAQQRSVMEREERRLAATIGMRWPYEA